MKKTYIFLIVAALCAFGVSAKSIYIWRNGIKTDLPIQTNDSITFDKQNAPTMTIWRNDSAIYQLALAVDDSITYSPDSTVTPPATICFDYDHWRDVDTINIYEDHRWQTITLPWASITSTTMPDYYRYPNLESHIDSINNDTVPTWQLAFNTCHNPYLDGVHMFGLWSEKSNIMRIYSYLEDTPNENAAYCFYRVEFSTPAAIDRDAMTWMPSQDILQKGNWNAAALSGIASTPTTTFSDLMPFASYKTDGTEGFEPVSAGWLCFDLPLATGTFTVPTSGSVKLYLEAVQRIDAHGSVAFQQTLGGSGTGSSTGTGGMSSTGAITIPGNDNRMYAGRWNAWGSFVHDIGSAITSSVSGDLENGAICFSAVGALVQAIGSCFTMKGNYVNAEEESKEQRYGLSSSTKIDSIKTAYDLYFDLSGGITGDFDFQLTDTLPTHVKPVAISYDKFFEGILAHPTPNQAAKMRKNGVNGNSLPLGIWNLKHQPVYYVYSNYDPMAVHPDGTSTLLSFFDPSSIELELNMDNPLFDESEIDSITLIAYDYVFVDEAYNLSAQPYYAYYGIPDSVSLWSVNASYRAAKRYEDFLIDQQATYKTFTKGDRSYTGVASDSLSAYGLGTYNMVYSPAIHIHATEGNQRFHLSEISVAVIVEMTFKNGEKRLFAERYLPEIKVLLTEDLKHIDIEPAPDNINGIPLKCPLHGMQRGKAKRLLSYIAM